MVFVLCGEYFVCFFFFKQKTAYEMRISDWSSDVCSSDLNAREFSNDGAVARPVRREPCILAAGAAVVRCAAVSRRDGRNAGERYAAGAPPRRFSADRKSVV